MINESKRRKSEKLVDSREALIESLEWNESSESATISVLGVTADVVNRNKRLYQRDVLRNAVSELSENIKSTSARSGRRLVTGELDHPTSKGNNGALLSESVILWNSVEWNENLGGPVLTGETFPTSKGKEFAQLARFLYERNMPIPISQRGYGASHTQNIAGQKVEIIESLKITGYDFVIEQSDMNAGVLSLENESDDEELNMNPEEVKNGEQETVQEETSGQEDVQGQQEVLVVNEELIAQVSELTEALTVKDQVLMSLTQQVAGLEQRMQWADEEKASIERQAAVTNWLREKVSGLAEDYPGELRSNLEKLEAATVEEIETLWNSKLEEYQPIVSAMAEAANVKDEANKFMDGQAKAQEELKNEGFAGIESSKPVWEERLAGLDLNLSEGIMEQMPKVLHVMDKITESKGGTGSFDPAKAPVTRSQKLAAEMFERYMNSHEDQVIAGAQEWDNLDRRRAQARAKGGSFDETPTLRSAYNLPYLVMAGVVPEVYASLISPEVFTVMPLKNETQRYYVEAWGASPTAAITNEAVTSDENAWVALAHPFIVKSSVSVTGSGGTPTYVWGTDYVIDTEAGRIWTVSAANGGSIGDSTAIKVNYTYEKLAEGENQPIEFVTTSATYATLTATAKRLGFNLSDEAIKFAASDLGYDTRGSHLQTATYRMASALDKKMFEVAEAYGYAAGMKSAAWTKTPASGVTIDENLRLLVDRIGDAIDQLSLYYNVPTHIVMAQSLAHKFHRTDLLDADVQRVGVSLAPGLVAGSLHNLPVYSVPYGQFSDATVMVLSGYDAVVKGIYSPLEAVGGEGFINRATTGDTNRLVAARAWYLQEYYDLVVPVDPTDSNLTRKIAVVPVGS